jgi:hypothetical protein
MAVRRRSFYEPPGAMGGPPQQARQAEGAGSPFARPHTPGPHGGGVNPMAQGGGGSSGGAGAGGGQPVSGATPPSQAPIPATPEDQTTAPYGGTIRPGNANLYTQPGGPLSPGAQPDTGGGMPGMAGMAGADGMQPHLMLKLLRFMGRL